jgi:hypothetical protein
MRAELVEATTASLVAAALTALAEVRSVAFDAGICSAAAGRARGRGGRR